MVPNLKDQWRRLLKRGQMVRLPVELHLLIIEQVERQEDLYNLLFVSRAFNFATERILYRDIDLESEKSQLQLFRTIILRERIAHYIQSLTISSVTHVAATESVDQHIYWNCLFQALCATLNLKKLCWQVSGSQVPWPRSIAPIFSFSGCTFQLHTLIFHAQHLGDIIPDKAFLKIQTELVVLDTPGVDYSTITPNAFPKLTTLAVSCPMTARLINRPTLRAVHLMSPNLIVGPWPSSKLITSFRLSNTGSNHFSGILRAYPCLRFLRIDHIALTHPSPSPSWKQGLEYIFTQLAHLIALEKLTLHFVYRVWWNDIMGIRDMVFNECLRNLQTLAIQDHTRNYVQLCRGAEDPEVTGRNGAEWRSERWQ